MAELVHWCDWSGQPALHIACDGTWTTPETLDIAAFEPFRAASGHLYAFAHEHVTCPMCRTHIARIPVANAILADVCAQAAVPPHAYESEPWNVWRGGPT